MSELGEALVPRPQQIEHLDEVVALPPRSSIVLTGDDPVLRRAAASLRSRLESLGHEVASGAVGESEPATIHLRVDPGESLPPEGYRLTLASSGIHVRGTDPAGAAYGVATLCQALAVAERDRRGGAMHLPGTEILDWPDYPARGLLLDVSRDRVPTMSTLFELVDLLAAWKLNQLQLYTEHTFAYRGHERVWSRASPLTAEEIRELDAYCRARGVELVPNQNSLGHLHRWLIHEPYRALAECPEGVRHPFAEQPEPFSLCPIDPGALKLLEDLYAQLLPCFTSPMVNVGLDETFDLGTGRSARACAERGRIQVYLDYLHQVHRLVSARQRRLQFWTDMMLQAPALLPRLPDGVVGLVWGYEADHPFGSQAGLLAQAGIEHYVCPGTSSWNSLAGRSDNALGNLANAALAGRQTGAVGYLITDWGDFGHLQPLSVSFLGLLVGAACAWNSRTARDPEALRTRLPALLDLHAFEQPDSGLGAVAVDLGSAYRQVGAEVKNGSLLFHLLISAPQSLDQPRFERLRSAGLARTERFLNRTLDRLRALPHPGLRSALARRELQWVGRTLGFACRLGMARLALGRERRLVELAASTRRSLARQLRPLIDDYGELWKARSRAGGFDDSVRRLTRIRELLDGR